MHVREYRRSCTFYFSSQVQTPSHKKRVCVSFKDTSISTAMSQAGAEHLLQTGMSEPSQTLVQGRSTSILLTFLSCLLNCTFPKAIKLLGNIAFIFRGGNLCPSDGPSLMKPFLSQLSVCRAYALSQSIMFPEFYILETAQLPLFLFLFSATEGV